MWANIWNFILGVLALLMFGGMVLAWTIRKERRRRANGPSQRRDLSLLRPYAWFLRRTHRFDPCACTTGEILAVSRTQRMRTKFPDRIQFKCTACGQMQLLTTRGEMQARAARRQVA